MEELEMNIIMILFTQISAIRISFYALIHHFTSISSRIYTAAMKD